MGDRLKEFADYFKFLNEILHGTSSSLKMWLLILIVTIVVLSIVGVSLLELAKGFKEKKEELETIEQKYPRVFAFLYSGKVRFITLAIIVLLLCVDWRDATTIGPPIFKCSTPPVPQVVYSSQTGGGSVPRWNENAGPDSGPMGPIAAVELVQVFHKPCLVKITASKDKPNLQNTIRWLLTQPSRFGGSGCDEYIAGIPNADQKPDPEPTKVRGLVVHWNEQSNGEVGKQVANFFQAMGFIVRVSHELPTNSPPTLIWLDFGPGSPYRAKLT